MQALLEKRPPSELDEKLDRFTRADDLRKAPPDPWLVIWEFRQRIEHDEAYFAQLLREARDFMEFLDLEQLLSVAADVLKARAEYAAAHINRLFGQSQPRPDAARASEERSRLMQVLTDWVRAVDAFRIELVRIQSAKSAVGAYKEAIREIFGQGIVDTISTTLSEEIPSIELSSPDVDATVLVDKEMQVHAFVASHHPNALGRVAIAYRGLV
ncbi:hypothetical protein [Vineibacter terrae]|uniref:hypothetical protein n=1 Tax=Vineibacter terrae TaxID=2586908 RepID=UPI002E331598|nr:hypothetical protein [Vineibacter terrae]HEX2888805.1 hypothetical protein [Vineibacter terrae]